MFCVFVVALRVYFDYVDLNRKIDVQPQLVDVKTIFFKTPECLLTPNHQNRMVPIVAKQDEKVLGKCDFIYVSRKYEVEMIESNLTMSF